MFGRDGFNKNRVRELKVGEVKGKGPIIYWMSRDQRVADNWALTYAKLKANEHKVPLRVVFTLTAAFPAANLRHYDFMLKGLAEVEKSLAHEGIPFNLLRGEPAEQLWEFAKRVEASLIVSDFDPLWVKRDWKSQLNQRIAIPHHEVDAHNVVPCWYASPKLEFGAYTLRPKIKKHLSTFLT
ncbi:MAG TPA: deoxyribodipyrimidine photo-lyase, partial [Tenuifilum sp.]|nr:deoxyribodipyrimidine photo-lyase [Tenuifilum sp.]